MTEPQPWIPIERLCSCCSQQRLFARLTAPGDDGFGKRLYTYICRSCDLSPVTMLGDRLNRALRDDSGLDPRDSRYTP